ncbi:MAG: hypothetical protein IKY23_04310 [Lachnospiraceae bacterium]|nr:hypothetical protein [Lachnospiraceae bacterium]
MKKKAKQIAALSCVILLVLLYVATLIVSLLDFPGSEKLFAACLLATVGLPILLWIYIWAIGIWIDRKKSAEEAAEASADDVTEETE